MSDAKSRSDATARVRALGSGLLGRAEQTAELSASLADSVGDDAEFMQVASCYRGRTDFDLTRWSPNWSNPTPCRFCRFFATRPTGLGKRARVGASTWESAATGGRETGRSMKSHVPPEVRVRDFLSSTFWGPRGSWMCPRSASSATRALSANADPTLVIGWAGWDHLQQAKALAAYYVRMKEQEGWAPERLQPLLGGPARTGPVAEAVAQRSRSRLRHRHGRLLRRLRRRGSRALGFTLDDVRAWQPPAGNTRRRRRASV